MSYHVGKTRQGMWWIIDHHGNRKTGPFDRRYKAKSLLALWIRNERQVEDGRKTIGT